MNKKLNSVVAYLIIIVISLICGIIIMSSIQEKSNEEVSLMLQSIDITNSNAAEAKIE